MNAASNPKRFHLIQIFVLAAPLLWVVAAALHPSGEPYGGIADEANRWTFVHVAQLILTPLIAAGVWMLLSGIRSFAAKIARAALVLWIVFFSAFDAIAGIATGVLTRHANSLAGPERESVANAIDFLFQDSQLAGGDFSILGNLGHGAWVIVAISAAVALYRARAAHAVVIATFLSVLLATHSGVGAVVGLTALFIAQILVFASRPAGNRFNSRTGNEPQNAGESQPPQSPWPPDAPNTATANRLQ